MSKPSARGDGSPAGAPVYPSTFERLAAAVTATGFGLVVGSVACVGPGDGNQGLVLRWHWPALIWSAVGFWAGWHLWSLLWQLEKRPEAKTKRRLRRYCIALALGGVAVFAYPFRFVAREQFRPVLTGLLAAFAVLSLVGWMIFRLVEGFADE